MKNVISDHKIDKLLGPSGAFAGFSLMIFGIIGFYFSLIITGLILIVAGAFMAFTYDGAIIDFTSRKIKSYTCVFGLFKIGNWHSLDSFNKFRIYKSNRTYTSYSRANVQLNLKDSDIRLVLLNDDGSLKITINKYGSFEEARKEMVELITNLQMTELKEWI
jgi:hypothetical protein